MTCRSKVATATLCHPCSDKRTAKARQKGKLLTNGHGTNFNSNIDAPRVPYHITSAKHQKLTYSCIATAKGPNTAKFTAAEGHLLERNNQMSNQCAVFTHTITDVPVIDRPPIGCTGAPSVQGRYQSTQQTCCAHHEMSCYQPNSKGNEYYNIPSSHMDVPRSHYHNAPLGLYGTNELREASRSHDNDKLFAADQKWQVVIAAPWKVKEHINSYELRSSSTSLRWLLSHPNTIGKRITMISDSQVAVGCLTKGRSSSHVLLRRLRSISAHILASNITLYTRWIPSAMNPADEPSRRFPSQV